MKDLWLKNQVQFPRLLAEIRAVGLSLYQYASIAKSMDVSLGEIDELLLRAETEFDRLKRSINPPTKEDITKIVDNAPYHCVSDIVYLAKGLMKAMRKEADPELKEHIRLEIERMKAKLMDEEGLK